MTTRQGPIALPDYLLRSPREDDADACFLIETSAYEGDEAATLAKIQRRIHDYPQGFLILEVDGEIIGFINSGSCYRLDMASEGFKELKGHDPLGPLNVVMSVVIHPAHQSQGWAAILMRNYIERMKRQGKQSIHLMCKSRHIGFYQRFGFLYQRPSASDHGGMNWHELALDL